MTIEIDVLSEAYTILKQYIPVKDRQEASDNLINFLLDSLGDHDIREFGTVDSIVAQSLKEYLIDDEDSDSFDSD